MANVLKMAIVDSILSLHSLHYSQRRIARELGIDRETVGKYLRERSRGPKPANVPTGSAAPKPATFAGPPAPDPKPANLPTGSEVDSAPPDSPVNDAQAAPSPATPPTSADEPPPRKKKLSRQAYRDEVTRLIEDVGLNCKADNECDAIALGAKICGGPAEYLTISRAVTAKYGDRLGELQATISELDKAQHKDSGMMGICTVLEKPNSRCLNSRCQVSH